MDQTFVHLHAHSEYSLLDSTLTIDKLVQRAKDFNQPAVALTDHGNMFGAIEFYEKAKKAGVKPILGCEIYFTTGSRFDRPLNSSSSLVSSQDIQEIRHEITHIILLCKNEIGYKNLCQIITKSYLEGMHYKPRADLELIRDFKEGLICLSACIKGDAGQKFLIGDNENATEGLLKLHGIFGQDFYLELQDHGIPEEKKVNSKIIEFAKNKNISLVATNDIHYLKKEDALAQDILLCVQEKKTFKDEERIKFKTQEYYFKSSQEMYSLFSEMPEVLENSLEITKKCNLKLNWKDEKGNQVYHIPDFTINTSETQFDYFKRLSSEGLEKRFQGPHFNKIRKLNNWENEIKPQYFNRMAEELHMINNMGFAGYFLIVAEFIGWAKERKIPVGPGRGSGAGSIVAYALRITDINPIQYNLLFERFINPERISMPDFDIDFCQLRRGEVIDHVTELYGKERVGQIVTFGKMLAKAALRDVSRVMDLPYSQADALAKLVPEELGITLEKALRTEPKFQELQDSDPKIKKIIDVSKRVEGINRHASIHAAGVIITNKPLVEYCPLFLGSDNEQVIQYDKKYSEKIGLVKFDFLGLKTLTVIAHASDIIRKNHDATFDIENIDLDDKNIFDFISKGETIGVFQLESSGMIDLCKRIKPDSIEDITAINALYRPGPMESGMVDEFVEIKNGRKKVNFSFPELEPVLKDTLGVIVYQEQVMNIARVIAGYTLGQADMLRRAMGKKLPEEMAQHKDLFSKGAIGRGFDGQKASDLFSSMEKFAEYGFNKSHAVAYAFIAYQTAFLKYYYRPSFFAGLLSTELDNIDKITAYINDFIKLGGEVLPPDVNESNYLFDICGEKIRFALGAIKNLGEPAALEIERVRVEKGKFKGFLDFCKKCDLKIVNKRALESLIKCGAFDRCDSQNRNTLLSNLELFMTFGHKKAEERKIGQGNIFDLVDSTNSDDQIGIKPFRDFEFKEKLDYEKTLTGIYFTGHPLDGYENLIENISSMKVSEVLELTEEDFIRPSADSRKGWSDANKRELTLAGFLTISRKMLTKKGEKMCSAILEDRSGKIECIVFPKVYQEFQRFFEKEEIVVMDGNVNLKETPKKFFPKWIKKIKEVSDEKVSSVEVRAKLKDLEPQKLKELKELVLLNPGTKPLVLYFEGDEGVARMSLGKEFLVNPSPQLALKINDVFKTISVKLKVGHQGDKK